MKGIGKFRVCVLALLVIAFRESANAQLTLAGTNYVQTFDSISNGLPPGWSVRTNATGSSLGAEAVLNTNTVSWGSSSGQFANYASTVNYGTNFLGTENSTTQNACTNRAAGLRQTGTFGDPGGAFVLQLQNTLGLAHFTLSVDLNMLSAQTRSNAWTIDYGIGSSPGAFTTVWTNADPGVFGSMTRTVSFGSALDNQSQNVWIRIVTLEGTAGSGSRDTFGIDNFNLSYVPAGIVAPIPLRIELIGSNAVVSWSNSVFALQSAPSVGGTYSNVPGATSPHTNPISGSQKFFRLKAN